MLFRSRECIRKGISSAIVISAGFKEAGSEGTALEEELRDIARQGGIRILGPNCLGVINTAINLNATFAKWMLPKGNLSFFSQSGALGVAVLDWAKGNRIGFAKFISLGNKVDLNETDFIEYLMNDPETDVILGYIEDVVEGERFMKVARECISRKPVILIKSGGTQAGARAASSHTGALAGSEEAFKAAFRQTGIIRASGIRDLFEIAKVFSSGKIPTGNRLLILTNAGGPGIIAADQAERVGLRLPYLNKTTINRLSKKLPRNASLYNPIDLIGDATSERYRAVLEEVIHTTDFDGTMVILTPQAMTDVDNIAKEVCKRTIYVSPLVSGAGFKNKMDGVSGFSPWKNTILIDINPSAKNWETSLKNTISHEYNHSVVYNFHKWETLLDSIIFEGFAEHFREQVVGGEKASWAKAVSQKECKKHFSKLKEKLNSKNQQLYREVFFGSEKYPLWLGYSLGYQIIKSFLSKNKEKSWII